MVLSPLQQETCFIQNLQHAIASLTVVGSWALGQNSLVEKSHIHKGGKNEIGPWQRHRYVCVLLRVALSYKIMRVLSEIMYELNQLHTPWPVMVYLWILVCTDIHEDTTCSHIRMNWHCRTTEKMGSPCYLRNVCSHLLPVKLCLGDKAW